MTSYEFPMLDEDKGVTKVVARLTLLLEHLAHKLVTAGWPLRLTMSGLLAFEAPKEGAADQLLRWSVEESFTDTPGRTLGEVCEAVGRLHDSLLQSGPWRLEDFWPAIGAALLGTRSGHDRC